MLFEFDFACVGVAHLFYDDSVLNVQYSNDQSQFYDTANVGTNYT